MVPPRAPSLGSSNCFWFLAFKQVRLSFHELRLDRELHARQAHRVAGEVLRHPGELEHDAAGLHDGHPVLWGALPRPHPRLGRLLRHRLVREEVDPDLAAALDPPRHGDARRLDLAIGDPSGLDRLEPEVAEVHLLLPLGDAPHAAALLLAELRLLRHQHGLSALLVARAFELRRVLHLLLLRGRVGRVLDRGRHGLDLRLDRGLLPAFGGHAFLVRARLLDLSAAPALAAWAAATLANGPEALAV